MRHVRKMSAKEIEQRLGFQYAQLLKESPQTASIYKDCREVIDASLSVMDHYNRISMAIQNKMSNRKSAGILT